MNYDLEIKEKNPPSIRNFTDLNAWKEAHKLVLMIYQSTKKFPKEERRTPEVTSALAAEIGSLIGEKTQGAQRVTYNAGGERVQNMKEQNVEHLTHNVEQNAKTETQIKPEDKLSSVVESPRKEVEMVRRVTSENKVTDPYREALG